MSEIQVRLPDGRTLDLRAGVTVLEVAEGSPADGVLEVIGSLATYQQGARARAVERFDTTPWLQRHSEIFRSLLESD